MPVALFVIEFAVVFLITLLTLHYFGDLKKNHFLVTSAVFASWFFSFLIIFILPMDVTNTLYNDCLKRALTPTPTPGSASNNTGNVTLNFTTTSTPIANHCVKPWSNMPGYVLRDLWRLVYWSSQVLSWLLLPIMQSYVYAGDFTVLGKIKTAVYENALWYGSYLVIFGALLIYVALKPELNLNFEALKLICITASNTWGLLLLVFLMGYGLVDLPRTLWNLAQPNLRLENTLFRVAKLSTEKEDAEEELANLLSDIKAASEEIRASDALRKHLDVIISKCPTPGDGMFSRGTDDYVDYIPDDRMKYSSIQGLIKLHKNLIVISHRAARTQFQWNAALKLIFYLEDVLKAQMNKDRIFKCSFTELTSVSRLRMRARWYWECLLRPWLSKLIAVVLFVGSVSVVWSEVTFFSSSPTLSILALLIEITKNDYMFFSMEVVSCLTIAYMCTCTYYTVFRMKFFNFYYFAPNHQTDANSLLFSGLLLCRLTYALCLNFLAMIHLDGHVSGHENEDLGETDFTKFMGHMDLLSFISKGLNIYYPMTVLLVCFCTYFSLGNRILHCFGVETFITDDDFSGDLVREGKEIAKREKRKLERLINGNNDVRSDVTRSMRNKYSRFETSNSSNRRKSESTVRIDDSDDDEMIDTSVEEGGSGSGRGGSSVRYTKSTDKLSLVDNIEYSSGDSPSRKSTRGGGGEYRGGGGGKSKSSVPRDLFSDA